jgi:hypothetical protein
MRMINPIPFLPLITLHIPSQLDSQFIPPPPLAISCILYLRVFSDVRQAGGAKCHDAT